MSESKRKPRALHISFDERQTNDYGEIWNIKDTEAEDTLKEAKAFVKTVADYLKSE